MKTIDKQDIVNFLEKNGYHKKQSIEITKEIAEKWSLKDLACFIACDTMNHRNFKDSLDNANYWKNKGKQAIIKQWFGGKDIYNL